MATFRKHSGFFFEVHYLHCFSVWVSLPWHRVLQRLPCSLCLAIPCLTFVFYCAVLDLHCLSCLILTFILDIVCSAFLAHHGAFVAYVWEWLVHVWLSLACPSFFAMSFLSLIFVGSVLDLHACRYVLKTKCVVMLSLTIMSRIRTFLFGGAFDTNLFCGVIISLQSLVKYVGSFLVFRV